MHPDLKILVEELTQIKNNGHGSLKPSSGIDLTHSEVISFARSMVEAIETGTIALNSLNGNQRNKIVFYLNLIKTKGIPHCDRSRAAEKCLKVIESALKSDDDELDSIPF